MGDEAILAFSLTLVVCANSVSEKRSTCVVHITGLETTHNPLLWEPGSDIRQIGGILNCRQRFQRMRWRCRTGQMMKDDRSTEELLSVSLKMKQATRKNVSEVYKSAQNLWCWTCTPRFCFWFSELYYIAAIKQRKRAIFKFCI